MTIPNISRGLSTRPYFLSAIDQLPESLLELARSNLPGDQVIEGIFVLPPEMHLQNLIWRQSSLEALIFTQKGVLYIAESTKKGLNGKGIWISADNILMIKLSLVLLYGKLEIFSSQNKQATKIRIEYNTVAHYLLAPVLHKLIRKTWQKNPSTEINHNPDSTFADFENTSYSFYNGLIGEALQPEEVVLGHVYQPEIREPWLKIFHKKLSPQMVLTLTDKQLIILQEDLKARSHYEWNFTFIPLYQITSMKQSSYKNWQIVAVQFLTESNQQPVELILEPENAQKWQAIWEDIFDSQEK